MRQLAWLNATPTGSHKSRRAQIDTIAEDVDEEPDYQLPDVEEAQYLLDALFEIGHTKMSGDKLTSIDWQDIAAWVDVTGAYLTPGESVVIRHLSAVYVDQHYNSLDSGCMSPHLAAPQNKVVIANKMKSLFAMLRGNKNER